MNSFRTAKSFWVSRPLTGEIRTEQLRAPESHEVLVETRYSGISRGTEALVFRGAVPKSEYLRMRAPFQQGDFPGPVKYGYAAVGLVVQGPPELQGRSVFCLHPHQSHFVVPADAVCLVPQSVPERRAVLAANLETAINGLWDALPAVGDRIAVIGAGSVGCLLAWLVNRIPGCEVELIDTNPDRAAVASALGVSFSLPANAQAECDLVFHVSGNPDGLRCALSLAGQEASVFEMSWFGEREAHLPLGQAFHSRRLSIRASQVGAIPAVRQARWTYRRRLDLALSLLAAPELEAIITGQSQFNELPAVMARLADQPSESIFHRIAYLQDS